MESDRQASLSALKVFTSRPSWMKKMLAIWKKLDEENYQQVDRCAVVSCFDLSLFLTKSSMLRYVARQAWENISLDRETIIAIYELRGMSLYTTKCEHVNEVP